MCTGDVCHACTAARRDGATVGKCVHDPEERHRAMPALSLPYDLEPSRVPTRPMPPVLAGTCELDLADGEQAAQFLELVARVIRSKGRLRITIE